MTITSASSTFLLRLLTRPAFNLHIRRRDASRGTRLRLLPIHDTPQVDRGQQEAFPSNQSNRFNQCNQSRISPYVLPASPTILILLNLIGRVSPAHLSPRWPASSGAEEALVARH